MEQVAVKPWGKAFKHKSFEERVAEYNGEISVCGFDWGETAGKEIREPLNMTEGSQAL